VDETRSADRLPAAAASEEKPHPITRNTGAVATGLTPGENQEYPEVPGYEILGILGHGGMGLVYRARQLKAHRLVALKMIRAIEHATPQERLRFQIETEAVARLQHPNIVQLYEVGEVRGQPFFSLEFCDGGTLTEQLKKKSPSPREAAELIETLARAMHYAHLRGVVHRDLKPGNVLLASPVVSVPGGSSRGADATPLAKITDFGLAKRIDAEARDVSQSGAIMGTASYMAPEQAAGKVRDTGPAADVYGLGALLYECLTGRPPFEGPQHAILVSVLSDEPVPPSRLTPKVPRDLETICLKSLQKEPARRYASAEALADDLHRFRVGEPIQARPVGRRERAIKWARRRPAAAALLAVSAASLVSLLVLAALLWHHAEERAAAVQDLAAARQLADDKRAEAARQERRAGDAQETARRAVYAADVQFAHAAWSADNVPRQIALLERYLRHPGEEDLRDFEWHYLWRLCHGERLTWTAYDSPQPPGKLVKTDQPVLLAFSPDGALLATASLDQPIKLWDPTTGTVRRTLPKPAGDVASLGFARDGMSVEIVTAAGVGKNPDMIEEIRKGRVKPSVERLFAALMRQVIPVDGRPPPPTEPLRADRVQAPVSLMLGGTTRGVMVNVIVPLKGFLLSPVCLAASADRKTLAVGGLNAQQGALLLWDLAADKEIALLKGHSGLVATVAFSPDGQTVASGDFDGVVRLWKVGPQAAAAEAARATIKAHASCVTSIVFSPDGKRFASAGDDGLVALRDTASAEVVSMCKGHQNGVTAIAFAPGGRVLASAGVDGVVKLWQPDAQGAVHIKGFKGPVQALAYSADGRKLIAVDQGGQVKVCDGASGRETAAHQVQGKESFSCAAVGPGGRTVAVEVGSDVLLFDVAAAKAPRRFHRETQGWVYSLAFSPDGATLAAGMGHKQKSGEITLWDVKSGKESNTLRGHRNDVSSVVFSPDGKTLASASRDGTLRLWDVGTGEERRVFDHGQPVSCAAFSADGRLLAAAAGDRVTVRDATTGHEVITLHGYSHQAERMAFSPNGRRLVTVGSGGEMGLGGGVKLWDLATGQELLTLGGANDVVTAVAFSPDGHRLASARTKGLTVTPRFGEQGADVTVWDATPIEGPGHAAPDRGHGAAPR
jgi:WD40 repeat protein